MISTHVAKVLLAVSGLSVLAACDTAPARPAPHQREVVVTPRSDTPPPPPPSQVYFYPTQGQSEAQQDRDRYECYNWAVKQTGYDPGRRRPNEVDRVAVVPRQAPNTNAIGGAATGAVLGAVVSHDSGRGAIIGAAAGALLGSAADNAQQQETRVVEERVQRRGERADEREASGYRRAMSACLEGRGYSVK